MTQYIDKDALVAEIKRRKEINKYRDTNDSLFEDEAILSWFKSLKQRYTWKPSEEQMKALYSALNDAILLYSNKVSPLYEEVSRTHFDALESLYNDLKKL